VTFEVDTTETHERRITRCKSCRARIIWLRTDLGRNMPVDADTVDVHDEIYEHGRHVSHFSTCPQGKEWSTRR
jgi:hypothetical protein